MTRQPARNAWLTVLALALASSLPQVRGDKSQPSGARVEQLKIERPVPVLIDDVRGRLPLFDGKTLRGWTVRGGYATYKVEERMIVGTTADGSPNTFLCKGPFSDFELEFDVLCDKELNSGVQIRSHVNAEDTPEPSRPGLFRRKGEVYGYQCEIAPAHVDHCGNFWDEGRRGQWWDDISKRPNAQKAFKVDQWNHYRIVAQGDHIRSWINGIACADFHDKIDASGFIGLQVHNIKKGTGPFHVRWKNLRIRELKSAQQVE
jgi:hypothetical protein